MRTIYIVRLIAADGEPLLVRRVFGSESAAWSAGEKHRPARGQVEVVARRYDGTFAAKRDWPSLPWSQIEGERERLRAWDDLKRAFAACPAVAMPGRAA